MSFWRLRGRRRRRQCHRPASQVPRCHGGEEAERPVAEDHDEDGTKGGDRRRRFRATGYKEELSRRVLLPENAPF
jgi:hypothetical protein